MYVSVSSTLHALIRFVDLTFFTLRSDVFSLKHSACVRVNQCCNDISPYWDCNFGVWCVRITSFLWQSCIRFYLEKRHLNNSMKLNRLSSIRHDALTGVRIGEATNPGPRGQSCSAAKRANLCLAICNPTALYGKVSECLQLNADIVCVSETSSTIIAQKSLNTEFANFGYRCFWSKDVPSLNATNDSRPSFRGEASGAAIITRVLARQPRLKIPDLLLNTCRFACAIFRIQSMDVLVISLYGFAKRYQEGVRMNDILFTLVHQVIAQVDIPFIIAGDFNEPPQKLPIYQEFGKIGVVEAFEYYEQVFGGKLPATCRGATRHDTAIIHHKLIPMIKNIQVKQEHLFDSHAPMFINFDLMVEEEQSFCWQIPQSWAPLQPKKSFIEENYANTHHRFFDHIPEFESVEEGDIYLLKWSKAVEHCSLFESQTTTSFRPSRIST